MNCRSICRAALAVLGLGASFQIYAQVTVPKVALYPWSFAENESGTSEAGAKTSQELLRKLFTEKAGYEVISDAIGVQAWRELGYAERNVTVEDPGQLPSTFNAKELLEFGKKAGVDFVCTGTLAWHVRSVWVGLGPKTKANATVNLMIIDVKKGEIAYEIHDFSSDDTKAEKWYESAGALLVAWGITLFSGGPKTPHIQKAAVKGIGGATDAYFSKIGKKIGGFSKDITFVQ